MFGKRKTVVLIDEVPHVQWHVKMIDLFVIVTMYFTKTHTRCVSSYTMPWDIYILNTLSNVFTNMQISLMSSYLDLKKESIIIHWCYHFKLATYILLRFSNMVCNFITFVGVTSHGLVSKFGANYSTWHWAYTNFTISGGLSSTFKESQSFALMSELGGSILCSKTISTNFDMQYSTSTMSSPLIINLSSNVQK